ncbi:UNVERIFIED_CONTAM: hypothetical protein K2H54_059937 [Gekko kuhli]
MMLIISSSQKVVDISAVGPNVVTHSFIVDICKCPSFFVFMNINNISVEIMSYFEKNHTRFSGDTVKSCNAVWGIFKKEPLNLDKTAVHLPLKSEMASLNGLLFLSVK